MKLLIAFVLIVTVGAIWEAKRDRPRGALPLLVVSTSVALLLFGAYRLV